MSLTRRHFLPLVFSALLLGASGCGADEPRQQPVSTDPAAGEAANPRVKIETNMGNVVVELFPKQAPQSVANFLKYVDLGFYNQTVFHRVIPGFMVQGGGYGLDLQRKPALAPIPNEADNGLRNLRGTLAMARTNDPNSATAQFFVNVVDNAMLDHRGKTPAGWGYAVFGKVVEGMDVVDKIVSVPTMTVQEMGMADVPKQPVVMTKVGLVTAGAAMPEAVQPKAAK